MSSTARGFRSLIMGPPGAGKGYVSKMICLKYGALHISTGDILRSHIRHRTAIGKEAVSYINSGELVPDRLLRDILTTAIQKAKSNNYVLDGYPRNLQQAKELSEVVEFDFAIVLHLPSAEIVRSLKDRMVHPASGRVYNRTSLAPIVPGYDDITGEKLVRRPDDEPAVVLERLRIYAKEMAPVLRFYEKLHIVHNVVGRYQASMWPLVNRFLKKRWSKRRALCFRPTRAVCFYN